MGMREPVYFVETAGKQATWLKRGAGFAIIVCVPGEWNIISSPSITQFFALLNVKITPLTGYFKKRAK
jgi:hypothetical protein